MTANSGSKDTALCLAKKKGAITTAKCVGIAVTGGEMDFVKEISTE